MLREQFSPEDMQKVFSRDFHVTQGVMYRLMAAQKLEGRVYLTDGLPPAPRKGYKNHPFLEDSRYQGEEHQTNGSGFVAGPYHTFVIDHKSVGLARVLGRWFVSHLPFYGAGLRRQAQLDASIDTTVAQAKLRIANQKLELRNADLLVARREAEDAQQLTQVMFTQYTLGMLSTALIHELRQPGNRARAVIDVVVSNVRKVTEHANLLSALTDDERTLFYTLPAMAADARTNSVDTAARASTYSASDYTLTRVARLRVRSYHGRLVSAGVVDRETIQSVFDIRNTYGQETYELFLARLETDVKLEELVGALDEQKGILSFLKKFSEDYSAGVQKRYDLRTVIQDAQILVGTFASKYAFDAVDDSGDRDLHYTARANMLPLVLANLWKNAVEEQEQTGVKTPITISLGFKDVEGTPHGYFSVRDAGRGIPDDRRETIFDQFKTSKREGSGFGLYFCREIVEQMEGKLVLDSKTGDGSYSVFEVLVPLQ